MIAQCLQCEEDFKKWRDDVYGSNGRDQALADRAAFYAGWNALFNRMTATPAVRWQPATAPAPRARYGHALSSEEMFEIIDAFPHMSAQERLSTLWEQVADQ